MKKLMVGCAAIVFAWGAFAADYTYTGVPSATFASTAWSSGAAPCAGNDYWLTSVGNYRTHWSSSETFSGDSLNIGSFAATAIGKHTNGRIQDNHGTGTKTYTFNKLVWWDGGWWNIAGSGYPGVSTLAGNIYIKASETENCTHEFSFGSTTRSFNVTAKVFGDESYGAISLKDFAYSTLTTLDAGNYCRLIFAGDNAGYKGCFANNDAYGALVLATATAIGDPNTPNAAAVKLVDNAAFALSDSFAQNPSRGIQLTGASAYFMTWSHSCTNWKIQYPVSKASGVDGKLLVRGVGQITLDCAYTAGDIEVQSGRLVLGSNLTLPAGLQIHVCAGATLIQQKAFPGVTVTTDAGGTVALDIPYDSTTRTATPLTMTATDFNALARGSDGKVALSLTSAIPIPFVETNVVEVITITEGSVDVSVLKDASAKTYLLPTTWFDTLTDAGGQHVRLVARPALAMTLTSTTEKNLAGKNWSDGKAPHAGADYYSKDVSDNYMRFGGGSNIASFNFGGESLTLTTHSVRDYAVNATLSDLRLFGGVGASVLHGNPNGYMDRYLGGNIYVDGCVTDSAPGYFYLDDGTPTGKMTAKLRGSGAFRYSGALATMPFLLQNNADDFTGRLIFQGSMDVQVDGQDDTVFGGALAALDAKGVRVSAPAASPANLKITATEDLTVETANRGWTITSGALGAAAGKTFTFNPPSLTVVTNLVKTGAGTLAMGCPTTATGATFLVQEGALLPKAVNCCDTFDAIEFSTNAVLAVDATETAAELKAKGLVAKHVAAAEPDGRIRIELRNWKTLAQTVGSATCAVLTVPSTEPDLTSSIELVGRGAIKTLSSETAGGYTTYTASYSQSGAVIFLK